MALSEGKVDGVALGRAEGKGATVITEALVAGKALDARVRVARRACREATWRSPRVGWRWEKGCVATGKF
jgi:hypothetical protein